MAVKGLLLLHNVIWLFCVIVAPLCGADPDKLNLSLCLAPKFFSPTGCLLLIVLVCGTCCQPCCISRMTVGGALGIWCRQICLTEVVRLHLVVTLFILLPHINSLLTEQQMAINLEIAYCNSHRGCTTCYTVLLGGVSVKSMSVLESDQQLQLLTASSDGYIKLYDISVEVCT